MFSAYNDIAYTIDQMHGIVDLNNILVMMNLMNILRNNMFKMGIF